LYAPRVTTSSLHRLSPELHRALLALVVCLCALAACGCASPAPTSGAPMTESSALSLAALDTLEREACPRLLTRTFPLADPHAAVSTGRLWVRRCSARRSGATLDLDVDVLGWQWSGEESWGFEVREYVYFSAAIDARLSASIEADAAKGSVGLRVWTDTPPKVTVREIGRVDARASNPASSMLGAASALVGQGPNELATAALRSRVRDLIGDRATAGIPIVIGEAPAVRGRAKAAQPPLLDETERLHPGGALISGSYPAGAVTKLRYAVQGSEIALARAVCVDEALELVDAVVAERARPVARTPRDVVTMSGKGEATLAALPCPWVLVTGARDDKAVTVALTLESDSGRALANPSRRWVRATLVSFDLSATRPSSAEKADSLVLGFSVGAEDAPRSFGRPLPASRSASVGLVAPLFEIARGAPIVVRALEQRPRAPSLWNATPGYDETVYARATITLDPKLRREERDVSLLAGGRPVGSARFVFEAMDVE
jgi:hypothetical protein